ncbi:hypothetical protein FIBSPDRAFT_765474, partial [Athelia psychrophila]
EYGNVLQAASWMGHDATVRLLIEKGADVNALGGQFGSALKAAISNQNCKLIVQFLLENGAIDEDSEKQAEKHRGDEETDDQDDEGDGSVQIEGEGCSTDGSSDEEWALAQEDPDDSTDD